MDKEINENKGIKKDYMFTSLKVVSEIDKYRIGKLKLQIVKHK